MSKEARGASFEEEPQAPKRRFWVTVNPMTGRKGVSIDERASRLADVLDIEKEEAKSILYDIAQKKRSGLVFASETKEEADEIAAALGRPTENRDSVGLLIKTTELPEFFVGEVGEDGLPERIYPEDGDWGVYLDATHGASKVALIKAIRGVTSLPLDTAKRVADISLESSGTRTPVYERITREWAETFMDHLKQSGAEASIGKME